MRESKRVDRRRRIRHESRPMNVHVGGGVDKAPSEGSGYLRSNEKEKAHRSAPQLCLASCVELELFTPMPSQNFVGVRSRVNADRRRELLFSGNLATPQRCTLHTPSPSAAVCLVSHSSSVYVGANVSYTDFAALAHFWHTTLDLSFPTPTVRGRMPIPIVDRRHECKAVGTQVIYCILVERGELLLK
jgi:hypothetical protein